MSQTLKPLKSERQELIKKVSRLSPGMLRGTLARKKIRCGNANCRCAKGSPHEAFALVYTNKQGKTENVFIPKKLVAEVERAVSCYNDFKNDVNEILEISLSLFKEKKSDPRYKSKRGRKKNRKRK